MSENLPQLNVHSHELLQRIAHFTQGDRLATPISTLCNLGVDIQASLRAAKADSPRINADPACRLVMIGLAGRMELNSFFDYAAAYDKMESDLKKSGPLGQRASWAKMAQDGAVNLTPMARSLFSAVSQVEAEGGKPEADASVRLIAHQMCCISQTESLTIDSPEASNLVAWCKAHHAALVINELPGLSKVIAP